MSNQPDLFGTVSGLPLDGATVTVTAARFSFDAEVDARRGAQDANLYMILTLVDEETQAERTEHYSIGSKHELADPKGEAVRATGREPRFSDRSVYGQLINAAVGAAGISLEEVRKHGTPLEANMWRGSRWVYGQVTVNGSDKPRLLPVEFLGYSQAAKSAKPPKDTVLSDADRATLLEVAKGKSPQEFIEAVFSDHQDLAVKKQVQAVLNDSGTGSIWAEANGE